jgi:receptor expression-enhancing protein 1/2/3/4
VLYQEHIHPFLAKNELAIDEFISSAHDRAKVAGLTYLKQGIELVKQYVFGLPPKEPTPPPTPSPLSYTQSLLARFNLPAARPAVASNLSGATSTAADFYTLLASAVSAATSSSLVTSTGQARDLSNSGTLIPPNVHGEERLSFIAAQRERLSVLLSALDKEANSLQTTTANTSASTTTPSTFFDRRPNTEEEVTERSKSAMSSRKSETDFEKIDAESGSEEVESGRRPQRTPQSSSGGWLPWGWSAKQQSLGEVHTLPPGVIEAEDKGESSAVEF